MEKRTLSYTYKISRWAYAKYVRLIARRLFFFKKSYSPSVFFAGAKSGSSGGAAVKVSRLKKKFSESYINFNIVYSLSNSVFLDSRSISNIKSKKIPFIHNQNGVFYPAWFEGDYKKMNLKMSVAYHSADYVFWQSQFCKDSANEYLGKRDGAGEVLHNAVYVKKFKPSAQSENSPFKFLVSGKLDKHVFYRVQRVVEAFFIIERENPNVELCIAGTLEQDYARPIYEQFLQKGLSKKLQIIGSYTQNTAEKIYQKANAFVILKHNDPCPNTVIEAMACGLPIIYSNTGGIPELVGPNAGIPLDCNGAFDSISIPDSGAVAEGMKLVIENGSKMGLKARQKAIKDFNLEHWLNRHQQIFNQYLDL